MEKSPQEYAVYHDYHSCPPLNSTLETTGTFVKEFQGQKIECINIMFFYQTNAHQNPLICIMSILGQRTLQSNMLSLGDNKHFIIV